MTVTDAYLQEAMGVIMHHLRKQNPNPSVNELCRVLSAKHLSLSKETVASLRRKLMDQQVRVDAALAKGRPVLLEVARPATVEQDGLRPTPEQLQAEREAKAAREAKRAEKWRARQAEREAQWAAERAAAAEVVEVVQAMNQPEEIVMEPDEKREQQVHPSPTATEVPGASVLPPKPKRTAAMLAERRAYLNELLDENPGLDPFVAITKLRERFGAALGVTYIYETCRIARELHNLPAIPRRKDEGREFYGREAMPTFEADVSEEEFAVTPEEELAWLARQAGDIMRQHNLIGVSLTMSVTSAGERSADWEFEVAPRTGRGSLKF